MKIVSQLADDMVYQLRAQAPLRLPFGYVIDPGLTRSFANLYNLSPVQKGFRQKIAGRSQGATASLG